MRDTVRRILQSPTRTFLAAASLLILLIAASIFAVSYSDDSSSSRGGRNIGVRYSVIWSTHFVESGDFVRIPPAWALNSPIKDYVSLFVAEGGAVSELVNGTRPAHVYLEQSPLAIDDSEIRRPTPPPGKQHHLPEGWTPPIDEYDSLDIAYVLDKQAVPQEHRRWISGFEGVDSHSIYYFDSERVIVRDGLLVRLQPVLIGLTLLSFLAFVASGARWVIASRRRPGAPEAQGTEALLRIAYDASHYVGVLKRLTTLNGVLLLLMGLFGLTAANYYMESLYHLSPWIYWNEAMMALLWILFLVLMTVWLLHYRMVSHEHRRMLDATKRQPLDA